MCSKTSLIGITDLVVITRMIDAAWKINERPGR
jgi:hypothetical protein